MYNNIIFENKIIEHVPAPENNNLTLADYCSIMGIEILDYNTANNLNESIIKAGETLFNNYIPCSDILSFIDSAIRRQEQNCRYKLFPPATTSKSDSRYVLMTLANIGFVNDFSFSEFTNSFLFQVNKENQSTIYELLSIGLYQMLINKINNEKDIIYNVTKKNYNEDNTSFTNIIFKKDNLIYMFNLNLAAGLEINVDSQPQQISRLKNRIFNSFRKNNNQLTREYYIVTPYVSRLLPDLPCIINLNNLSDFISAL